MLPAITGVDWDMGPVNCQNYRLGYPDARGVVAVIKQMPQMATGYINLFLPPGLVSE